MLSIHSVFFVLLFCLFVILNWLKSLNLLIFFCLWNVYIVKNNFTSNQGLFTGNDSKDAVSLVQVDKML